MSSEAQAPNPLMQEVGLDDEPEELFSTPEAKATTAKVANPLEDDLATEENSSGYASVSAPGGTGEVPRSDTLEDVSLTADSSPEKVTVSPEVGSPAEANPLEPEPEKPDLAAPNAVGEEPAFAPVRLSDHPSPPGSESAGRTSRSATQSPQPGAAGAAAAAAGADEYAEEENPFQHAHLNPQLQLSGQQPQNPNNAAFNQAIAGQNGAEISGNSQQDPEERRERDSNDDFIDIKVTEPHKIGEAWARSSSTASREDPDIKALEYPHKLDPYERETIRIMQDVIAISKTGSPVNISEAKPQVRDKTVPVPVTNDQPN